MKEAGDPRRPREAQLSSRTSTDRSSRRSRTRCPRSRSRLVSASCARASPAAGFFVLLDGEVASASTGRHHQAGQGRLLRRDLPAARRAGRRRRRDAESRSRRCSWPVPTCAPSCSPIRRSCTACSSRSAAGWSAPIAAAEAGHMAVDPSSTAASSERPFPPGDYGVVVVGSGPGGLQVAYYLSRLGIDHAVISADPGPGRHVPALPVLPATAVLDEAVRPAGRTTRREYERYDWNSLIAFEPEHRAVMPDLMDGTSEFPSRAEMEAGIRLFAERTGLRVALRDALAGHHPRGRSTTSSTRPHGDYRSRVVIFAVGIAEPLLPETPGIEHGAHYADTRDAASYAGRRLFIIGKQNSGFELASGLLHWASPIVLASPRPAQLSVNLHSLGGVRARYMQPWEDADLGGGVFILDASIERIERRAGGIAVHTRRSDNGEAFVVEVDEVIAATGFRCAARRPRARRREPLRAQRPAHDDEHVRERHGAGHLLRGHHRPGRLGPQEVRHPGQLRRRPRPSLQRPTHRRRHRVAPLRRSSVRGPRCDPATSWSACSARHARSRAVAPEVIPGARA